MEEIEVVQCPYCGQEFELSVDTSMPSQDFVTDCEICCHALEIHVECQPGEILRLDLVGG